MLRITSKLDPELEALVHRTIGCCIAVHRELGPGLVEAIYQRAVAIELQAAASHSSARKRSRSRIGASDYICIGWIC